MVFRPYVSLYLHFIISGHMQLSNYFKILKCYIIRLKGFKNSRIYKLVSNGKKSKIYKTEIDTRLFCNSAVIYKAQIYGTAKIDCFTYVQRKNGGTWQYGHLILVKSPLELNLNLCTVLYNLKYINVFSENLPPRLQHDWRKYMMSYIYAVKDSSLQLWGVEE